MSDIPRTPDRVDILRTHTAHCVAGKHEACSVTRRGRPDCACLCHSEGGTTLYRIFDTAGALLYVGVTGRGTRRIESHAAERPWWSQAATIRLQHLPDRASAERAERDAIVTERPRYNHIHVHGQP